MYVSIYIYTSLFLRKLLSDLGPCFAADPSENPQLFRNRLISPVLVIQNVHLASLSVQNVRRLPTFV